MVDLIPERIWSWVVEGWRNMADLADKIDDMICTFEGEGETTMDTVAMYMFGWMMFGLVVLGIGKFVYGNFVANKDLKTQNVIVEPPVTVTKSENSVVDAAVKQPPKDIVVKSSGGGKYVPPTPPSRKRLGSRSGRPVVGPAKPKSTNLIHPPPTATGPESESVKWVNELFFWLYSDLVIVNELLSVWIQSLNDFTKKSVDEHGVGAEFVRVLGETQTPVLNNVFCECAPNDDVTITCDCEATPALQLKVFRQKGEKVEVSHYRVNVNRFRARLSIFCITEKLLADVKCDGWPDIKVSLAQVGAIKNNMDESQLQEVITEIVTVALRNTEVHFNLSQYPTCPRLNRYVPPPSHLLPVHYDSLLNSSHSMSINSKTADKRLLVKVVKAVGLGCKKGVQEPFCIVELDEPPQKNQTSLKKDTDSPVWDEHFLFDISGHTSEILFEVYDRAQGENKFLGLAIVGVEELLINPSQRQTISLQSRPYQEDTVSGMLTLEFLFIEGADLPQMGDKPFKLKETLKSVSPSGKTVTTTKTVFAKPGPTTEHLTNGGDGVTDSALRDLELRNKGPPTQTSKSTLIIHSVQRQGMRETTGPGGTQGQHVHILQPSDNQAEGYLSVPPREGSTRSSLSEASGISGASNRTYINEASTLVLETIENGIKKYYLVPLSIAQKSKWKKKGTKLHIFNDHTFIAKHLPGGTQCQVCSKVLPRRLGKQGYECRDCQLKCHKMCHIRADNTCPSSNIQSIELCADASSPYSVRRLMRQTQPQR
uniref:Phorbol-ester/DAG-type domain-containing protein n=1 Tax=Homalodisca liturata TaxID=320908 RepID=A0A1B6IW43_9HEMI